MSQFDDLMAQTDREAGAVIMDLSTLFRISEARAEIRRVQGLASATRVDLDIIVERCETRLQELKD